MNLQAPKVITVGSTFVFYFSATQASVTGDLLKRFKISLVYPGFSTHNQRHGMRNVDMNLKTITVRHAASRRRGRLRVWDCALIGGA